MSWRPGVINMLRINHYMFRTVSTDLRKNLKFFTSPDPCLLTSNFPSTQWACTWHPASNWELQVLFAWVLSHLQVSQHLVNNWRICVFSTSHMPWLSSSGNTVIAAIRLLKSSVDNRLVHTLCNPTDKWLAGEKVAHKAVGCKGVLSAILLGPFFFFFFLLPC